MRHQLLSSPLSLNFDLKHAKETGEYCDEDDWPYTQIFMAE